jgi:Holliday junction resolvasome RuvABC endonuclease subunit
VKVFIGIDQSINSTGITIQKFDKEKLKDKKFYIIHNSKLTKKEMAAQQSLDSFEYILYNKFEKAQSSSNSEYEEFKLKNAISISENIINLIIKNIKRSDEVYIGIEGVSFNSTQTKSLTDLAGLSYIIRYKISEFFKSHKNNIGELIIFTPGEIKKFATGNGNAKKESMISLFNAMHNELMIIPKIDDLADSYWICEYLHNIIDLRN